MATIRIRDISEDVVATLTERATAGGQTLDAYLTQQLVAIAARPTNEDVVRRLREQCRAGGPDRPAILTELHISRR